MLEICAIASGSNGNCYYIGNKNDAILIDAGISRKKILERMEKKGLDPKKIRAIIISHEHTDHMRGVRVLAKNIDVPVFMTPDSWKNSWGPNRPDKVSYFSPGDVLEIGSFKIHSFLKNHDAAEPCSFRLEYKGKNVGVFTDIGSVCDNVKSHFAECQAVFLESNYDEEMLWKGTYPIHLKERVASDYGHLSNMQAYELLSEFKHPKLKMVFLSHLSQENNSPEIAMNTFKALANELIINVTNRYDAGDVFEL